MEHERERSTDERLSGLEGGMSRIEQKLDNLSRSLQKRFEGIDQRFDGVDQRFEGIDKRLDKIEILARDSLELAKNLTDSLNATRENMERGFRDAARENRADFRIVHDAIRSWGRRITALEQRERHS